MYSKEIQKIIKHYRYKEDVCWECCSNDFFRRYNFFANPENLKNYPMSIYSVFNASPDCEHITAKKLLFQGHRDCWLYFDRTAHFRAYSQKYDQIDFVTSPLNYALYVQRVDLIKLLLEKMDQYFAGESYISDKNYIKQKVYPSSYLIHFLIEKYGIKNGVKEKVEKYGNGIGLYQRLIDEWDNSYSEIENSYWDELCNYHVINIKGTKRENEEFIAYGLIPMELLNVFIVRKKLGLDIPHINHELFKTPMAIFPPNKTVYDPSYDAKFQLVHRTVLNKKKLDYNDIVNNIISKYGEDKLFR